MQAFERHACSARPSWCHRVALIGVALPIWLAASAAPSFAQSGTVVVAGTGLGPVPDGSGAVSCGAAGAPREVLFEVPPLPAVQITDVDVEFSFAPTHPWAGDLSATLIAPHVPSGHTLFGRIGATTANGCGDSSDLAGPYVFSDAASPPNGGLWEAAVAASSAVAIPAGSYFTTNAGGEGAANPMPPTSLQAAFGGRPAAAATGTWTLRVTDQNLGDTTSVASARLVVHYEGVVQDVFSDAFEFTAVARAGSNLGAIPDGLSGCGNPGAPRDVAFSIPPFPGYRVADVEVRLAFAPAHPWASDISAQLIAPGGTRQHMLFGRVGVLTAAGCGDSSDLQGPYRFSSSPDAPPYGGFWQATAAAGSAQAVASGQYFATASGGVGAVSPMPATSLQATFGGMTSAESAGTWTLRLTDSGAGDTTSVSEARLLLRLERE